MKTSVWMAACVAVAFSTSVLASTPVQDKPASKTTTSVKTKTSPSKTASATTTKTVHKTHVKKS